MKIFISWSGQKSRAVASALREFIPLILQPAQVFTTSDDIDIGSRWYEEISNILNNIDLAIICLTPESLDSPWLIFEAGALSKSVGSDKVIILLVGLSPIDITGPLAQFQACSTKKSDIYRMLSLLNKDSDPSLSDSIFNKIFEAMWPGLENNLKAISFTAVNMAAPIRSERELLEELVRDIRNMEGRIKEIEKKQKLTTGEESETQ